MLTMMAHNPSENSRGKLAKAVSKVYGHVDGTPRWRNSFIIIMVSFLGFVLRSFRTVLLISIFISISATTISRFIDIHEFPLIRSLIQYEKRAEKPLRGGIHLIVPTKFEGHDFTYFLLLGTAYVLSRCFGMAALRLTGSADRLRRKLSEQQSQYAHSPEMSDTHSNQGNHDDPIRKAAAGGKLKRKDLLEIYVEAKKSLDEQKRHLAFLSIDVVDSTGMKMGEEPGIAERDFNRYKKLVVEIINKHRALKSTWTPDGVMVCYNDVADAVMSAQAIIKALVKFNKDVKVIKRDFNIRAGINSGDVFYEEATPLEEMTDRVIDIAGHMQKHGCVNGVTIGRHSIEQLISEFDFHDAGREVDGCQIYEWN